jgi:hypothetical protein
MAPAIFFNFYLPVFIKMFMQTAARPLSAAISPLDKRAGAP